MTDIKLEGGASLKPFQTEDVLKLKDMRSRLIGNEPGTGKTYEGIALDLVARAALKPEVERTAKTLVIAPKSVLGVWDMHLMELTTQDIYVLGQENKGMPAAQRKRFLEYAMDPRRGGYFVVNWDSLRLMPELRKNKWLHIIGDEIHRAKNPKAQVHRSLIRIPTMYKTGMSGTPADNKPQDLWAILNWLWPKYYTSYWRFVKTYGLWEKTDEGYSKFVGVNPETVPRLHKEMEPWFVRRRKQDVLKDLPPKYYSRVWVDLDPKQRRAYDQMRKAMVAWVDEHSDAIDAGDPIIANAVVAQLIRLQQFAAGYLIPDLDENGEQKVKVRWKTNKETQEKERIEVPQFKMVDPSAKIDTVMELIKDREQEQIIVFSRFRQVIDLLATRLEKAGIPYGLLTGAVRKEDRDANVQAFQEGHLRVFAGTIQAGGVGITLTASSTVIFIDRWWSPSVNTQAEDRAHRIGQEEAVEIIDLMARNTVDLGVHQQIATKAKWLHELLGDEVDTDQVIKELDLTKALEEGESDVEDA